MRYRAHLLRVGLLVLSILLQAARASAEPLASLARPLEGSSERSSSSDSDLDGNLDSRQIAPGAVLELANLSGPGTIVRLWCTVISQDPFHGRGLVLRIYWDGAANPSVVAPLGDFFGTGHGALAEIDSIPASSTSGGRARSCFWHMPFRQSARITVANESTRRTDAFFHHVDWRSEPIPSDAPYFHAQYRQSFPAAPGPYRILETTGRGHYAGTVLSVQLVESGWFGEGDEFFYLDGESVPSIRGTGTEDYVGEAFGFRPHSRPWSGVGLWEGSLPGDRISAYRWHVEDPVVFQSELVLEIEHKGEVLADSGQRLGTFLERADWLSSVAFWYQHPMRELGATLPPYSNRLAPYRVIGGAALVARATPPEGLSTGTAGVVYRGPVAEALVEIEFDVAADGWYQINALLAEGPGCGVVQPRIDGAPLGPPLDLFLGARRTLPRRLELVELKAGTHVLGFELTGASPKRRPITFDNQSFATTHIMLLRVQDMEGYHDALDGALLP